MKRLLFVFRILLPPLLFLRLNLLRLTEASLGHQTKGEIMGSPERSSGTERLDMRLFDKLVHHRSSDHGLVEFSAGGDKVIRDSCTVSRMLKHRKKASNFVSTATINESGSIRTEIKIRQDSLFSSHHVANGDVHHSKNSYQREHGMKKFTGRASEENISSKKNSKRLFHVPPDGAFSLNSTRRFPDNSPLYKVLHHRTRRSTDEVPRRPKQPRSVPPEYMVHLFQLLSDSHYQMMLNMVVTGFLSINTEGTLEKSGSTPSRKYKLVFDVFVSQEAESIHYAELRMFVIPRRSSESADHNQSMTDVSPRSYRIAIFEVSSRTGGRRLVVFKNIKKVARTWISFDVTSVIKVWPPSGLRSLEVRFEMFENGPQGEDKRNETSNDSASAVYDDVLPDVAFENGKEPLLVVFSEKSDNKGPVFHERDKRDVTEKREMEGVSGLEQTGSEMLSSSLYFQGLAEFISATGKDSSKDPSSETLNVISRRVRPDYSGTFVDKDKSTLLNTVYNITFLNVQERFQLSSKDSSVNQLSETLKNTRDFGNKRNYTLSKAKRSKRNSDTLHALGETMKVSEDFIKTRVRRDTKARYRRHLDSLFRHQNSKVGARFKRSKKKRNSCQRGELYVDFETIKWDKVIIFPRGYQAFMCTGKCYTPISEYLTPTKHAILQTLVHTSYPDQASRACCVPTKLDPISILYWDEKGDIKYEFTYEGMVVAECGCR